MSSNSISGLVSVVTPFYNAARYLEEAIASVRAQIYEDWELLLADDGSDDGGSDIARRWAAQDARIRYLEHLQHARRGTAATRNLALTHARGEFIALLDADDVWLPHKLAEHVAILRAQESADWVAGRSEYFYDDNAKPPYFPREAAAGFYTPPILLKLSAPLGEPSPPTPSALMLRRSRLGAIGAFEESFGHPHIQYYEDQAFLAKLYLHAAGTIVDRCCTRYRLHGNSTTAIAARDRRADDARRFYFDWLRKYLRAQRVDEPEIWQLLERRTWRDRHSFLWTLTYPARRVRDWLRREAPPVGGNPL